VVDPGKRNVDGEAVIVGQLEQFLHPIIDESQELKVLAKGLPASPGAAVGKVVFTAEDAAARGRSEPVILVRKETVPDDIEGMNAAVGILTSRGGMTSHAAVVARGMGKCCVAGCEAIRMQESERSFKVNGTTVKEGDWISLDGTTGRVILGKAKTIEPDPQGGDFAEFMGWADRLRRLRVRANADIPRDAQVARRFGAQGIGLSIAGRFAHEGAELIASSPAQFAAHIKTESARWGKVVKEAEGLRAN